MALFATILLSGGCSFDRSGLDGKLNCDSDDDCPAGQICINEHCATELYSNDVNIGDLESSDTSLDLLVDSEDDVASETGQTDADDDSGVTDVSNDTADSGVVNEECPGAENACGGCDVLDHGVGTACGSGECGLGTWQCVSDNAVSCVSTDVALNACGGCATLAMEPGEDCGDCGEARCVDDPDQIGCVDPGFNSCESCIELAAEPDTSCGDCGGGTWICDPVGEDVVCDTPTPTNACGGCDVLEQEVGDPCSATCGAGFWDCATENTVLCDAESGTINSCGGCDVLENEPGTLCDSCGEFHCTADPNVTECIDPGFNLCETCAEFEGEPGTACGPCLDRLWECATDGLSVECHDPTPINACEGCGDLEGDPGTTCGDCGGGEWVCTVTKDAVDCVGANPVNECGGCTTIPDGEHEDDLCGPCDLDHYDCVGGTTVCSGYTFANDCDGCTPLGSEDEGQPCGPCGLDHYVCTSTETTVCSSSTVGDCGCNFFDPGPGDGCGPALCDEYVCDDDDLGVHCSGSTALNSCDGCDPIPTGQNLGDPCGPCGEDRYYCIDDNTTDCDGETYLNSCYGCGSLDGEPGNHCSCGGGGDALWECDGAENVVCTDGDDGTGFSEWRFFGSGNENTVFPTQTRWIDWWGDYDIHWAQVVDEVADQRLALNVSVTRPYYGVNFWNCIFYRYSDERGGDLFASDGVVHEDWGYNCGGGDDCYWWDASEGTGHHIGDEDHCEAQAGFDPENDLYGCCDFYPTGHTYHAEIYNIDHSATVDDGDLFMVVTRTGLSFSECNSYQLAVDF